MIESLKQLLAHLYDVKGLIEWGGPALVCVIVFIETGMFVGFFLPGDSLLVTAGVFAGAGHASIAALLIFVTLCADCRGSTWILDRADGGTKPLQARRFAFLQEAPSRARP